MITHSKRQKQMSHATPLRISRNFWHSFCLSFCNFMRRCWQGRLRRSTIYLCVVMERARRRRRASGFRASAFTRAASAVRIYASIPFERARHLACAEGLFRSRASSGLNPPTLHPPPSIRQTSGKVNCQMQEQINVQALRGYFGCTIVLRPTGTVTPCRMRPKIK